MRELLFAFAWDMCAAGNPHYRDAVRAYVRSAFAAASTTYCVGLRRWIL